MKNHLFYLVMIVLVLGVLEVAMRLVFPVPEALHFNRINYSVISTALKVKPKKISNSAFSWASRPDDAEFVHHLNLYGFRDRTWNAEKRSGDSRVMFVGDSFVEGFMAADQDTIPKGYESSANEKALDVETLNLGVGASGFPEYFGLINDAIPLFDPDVLVLILYANDFPVAEYDPDWLHRSTVPAYANSLLPRAYYVFKNISEAETVPRAWKRKPFSFLSAVPNPSNPWSKKEKAKYNESFVDPRIAEFMKKGEFNPFAVNENKKYKRKLQKPFDVLPHLGALSAFTDEFGVQLSIVYIPSRGQVSNAYLPFQALYNDGPVSSLMESRYQRQAATVDNACRRLGIPFLDMTSTLRRHEREGTRLYWDYDEHMKGEGYLLVGRSIFAWWDELSIQ